MTLSVVLASAVAAASNALSQVSLEPNKPDGAASEPVVGETKKKKKKKKKAGSSSTEAESEPLQPIANPTGTGNYNTVNEDIFVVDKFSYLAKCTKIIYMKCFSGRKKLLNASKIFVQFKNFMHKNFHAFV